MTIKSITPYQILDSRGEPTLMVSMTSDNDLRATYAVPAGSSLGSEEALEKRDGEGPYNGLGVTKCIEIIDSTITPKFIGYPLDQLQDFDGLLIALDGSERKQNLGANTLLALSGAYLKLSAKVKQQPLWQYIAEHNQTSPEFPRLFACIVGGGKHAPGLDIQEFLVAPQNNQPSVAISNIYDIYQTTQKIMQNLYGPSSSLVGDEGGLAPIGANTEVVLETLSGINSKMTDKFDISLDSAANSFYQDGLYNIETQQLHSSDLYKLYQDWNAKFNIFSIEDPFAEGDLEGTEIIKGLVGQGQNKPFMIFADDFTVSNKAKIEALQANALFDGIVIKPNQVGTFTETFEAIAAARASKAKVIISQRSGETIDSLIADLAYGVGAMGLKLGAPARGERIAKYNRLLEIEADLDSNQKKAAEYKVVSSPQPIEKSPSVEPNSSPAPNTEESMPEPVNFQPPASPLQQDSKPTPNPTPAPPPPTPQVESSTPAPDRTPIAQAPTNPTTPKQLPNSQDSSNSNVNPNIPTLST